MYNLQGTVMLLALIYVVLCPFYFVLIFTLHDLSSLNFKL